ncbi:MAG: hypothetical protein CW338_09975 [Clostridiales bacterium]|nr:hypothetical protein [Clostridiales bacterium]
MLTNEKNIWVGTSGEGAVCLLPSMANRHGLISGATGTGKTVTLQVMAEAFSQLGVPVFMADVKGDLAGISKPCEVTDKIQKRLDKCGITAFPPHGSPVTFWDVYGEKGHPVRTTVTEMGPLLLARLLGLNDTQSGVLHLVFRIADDEGLLLIDLKDIKAMLAYVGEDTSRYTLNYGNITKASLGAIQRAIAILEDQGGNSFFGEPAIDLEDWIRTDENGMGMVNILCADKLFQKPVMYSTVMLWMLGELYEMLPEQGDSDLPRMVFFFDEAHLLFDDCPKALMEKIEQTVRLIRSKGVGVYFVTQNPTDVPSSVLSQLSGRVQHALRAFTPQEQKIIRAVSETYRTNPAFDTAEAISNLKTGEALLSFLNEDGAPCIVQRATILPPQSSIGAISDDLRRVLMSTDPVGAKYDTGFDRVSAYETLAARLNGEQAGTPVQQASQEQNYQGQEYRYAQVPTLQPVTFQVYDPQTGTYETRQVMQYTNGTSSQQIIQQPAPQPVRQVQITAPVRTSGGRVTSSSRSAGTSSRSKKTTGQKAVDSFVNSVVTTTGRELGRSVTRSVLGLLGLGSRKRK